MASVYMCGCVCCLRTVQAPSSGNIDRYQPCTIWNPVMLPRLATDLLVFAPNFLVVIAQALNSLRYFHELLSTTK